MINFFIYIFILFSFIICQEQIGTGLYQNELITYLQTNYTSNQHLGYNDARDILYSEIDNNNNNVYCIYTNYSVQINPSEDPSTHMYNNGINCEHLWPQSMGASGSPMKSDMHHLRPCKENVNSSRGNKPFNDILDYQTNTWFWLQYSANNIPQNNLDEYSESGSAAFEPREDVKGDVARAMFYFYTIYNDDADAIFFNSQKDILYSWHVSDPPNSSEINRTWEIASYQNNIPNPFILDNSLIFRAYFYENSDILIGDVTGDGYLNVVDIVLIVNFILETQNLNDEQIETADTNMDDTINIVDIIYLINLITGE